jgi:ABC-2 type transport system permease protein
VAEALRIYGHLAAARVRADWQYRTSFVLFTLGQALITVLDFIAIAVIFGRVDVLAGWSLAEVAFLYGASGTAFGLADCFVSAVERCSQRIKDGTFDRLLIRPLGPLLQLSAEEFAFRRFGKLAQAMTVLGLAIGAVGIDWTVGRAVMVPVMVLAGFAIFGAVFVLTSSLAFWTVDTQEFANAFTYGGNFMTQYPLAVFAPWMRRLAMITGISFVNYFPVLYLLGRDDPAERFGLPAAATFASPVVGLLVSAIAVWVWRTAIRHYRSTGS